MEFSRDQENELGLTLEKMFQWLLIYDIHRYNISRNVKLFFSFFILNKRCLFSCFIVLLSKYCFSQTAFGYNVIRNNVLKLGYCLFFAQMSVKQSDVIQITLQQLERNVHNEKKRKKTENFLNLHLISKVFVCFAKFFFPFLRSTASRDRNDLIFS
jgi:hypothetical protein